MIEICGQDPAVGTYKGQDRTTAKTNIEVVPEFVPSPPLLAILHCGLETSLGLH